MNSVAACLIALVSVACSAPVADASDSSFGVVAEGFTSPDATTGIDAGYRMFTAPETPQLCAGPPASRLVVDPDPVRMQLGRWLDYTRLRVLAFDRGGNLVPRVPIVISVQTTDPPVVATHPTDVVSSYPGLLASHVGRTQIRIHAMCPRPEAPRASIVVVVEVER